MPFIANPPETVTSLISWDVHVRSAGVYQVEDSDMWDAFADEQMQRQASDNRSILSYKHNDRLRNSSVCENSAVERLSAVQTLPWICIQSIDSEKLNWQE